MILTSETRWTIVVATAFFTGISVGAIFPMIFRDTSQPDEEQISCSTQRLVRINDGGGWRDYRNAPRDGTTIEIKNSAGVAPYYDIYFWKSDRQWVLSYNNNYEGIVIGMSDGPYLQWRPYQGDSKEYIDPTGGEQNKQEYWRRAAGLCE